MAGVLPQMQFMDVTPALQAYSLGSKQGQEDTDRNILRDVGQVAARDGIGAASKVALERGDVKTGLALGELSLDRQVKMFEFLGRAAVQADTPEKWNQYVGILSKQFGPESVKGFENFSSRESAILLSGNAFKTAQQQKAMQDFNNTITGGAPSSEPRGIRNNNPLNIEAGRFTQSSPGFQGSDGRFARFASPEQGIAAADRLLTTYGQQGINTVAGVINKWAPPTENNSSSYAATVAKSIGVDPNAPINLSDPATRQKLIGAMAQVENGKPLPTTQPSGYDPKVLRLISAANNPNLPKAQQEIAGKLLEHALKTGDLPDDIKKYNLAVQQGETRSFTDWDIARKREGATRVTQVNRGEDSYDKTMGETFAKRYVSVTEAGDKAFATLGSLSQMRTAISDPKFYSGIGADQFALPIKQVIVALGGDPNSAGSMENFRALSNKAALEGMGGSLGTGFSNADRDFIVTQYPALNTTPAGNLMRINALEKIERRKIDVARMAQEYTQRNGRMDAGFDRELTAWREKNPLFSEQERGEIKQLSEAQLPKAGSVEDGWRYKGGDRAKRENWERVNEPKPGKRSSLGDGVVLSDANPDEVRGGQQYAQSSPIQISPGANGQYSVINIRTGQTIYTGSLAGARQIQAQQIARTR